MADTNTKYNFLDYEGLSLFWNNVKNVIKDNESITASALTNLNTRVDTVEGALANQIISITYTDLKALRDGGQLVPGQQYRITDYTCTTTTTGTTSAGHVFDIIVTADDENTLNEVARAIQHDGDTYFANCDLNAWKIWYCLDNDTTRFAWADGTNGKGVIYRMIDEFNNDVPYDFKNIQFYRQWDSYMSLWGIIPSNNTGVPCYTFSSGGSSSTTSFTDMSLSISNVVYSNVIKGYVKNNKQTLNNNCFFGTECYSNTFGNNCYGNSLGKNCYFNSFGNYCLHNGLNTNCYFNSFKNYAYSNVLGRDCFHNIFGDRCFNNTFKETCHYNTFGNNCRVNSLGVYCQNNTFGNGCQYNSFNNQFSSNTLGNDCSHNSFGNGCNSNTFGEYCSRNTVNNYFCSNSFGSNCSDNTFGYNCASNYFGNDCHNNSFGDYCSYNSFGNDCDYNSFRINADNTSSLTNFAYYNHFNDGCSYNVIWNSSSISSTIKLKNININRGVVGTDSSYNMININTLNSEQEINVNQIDGIVSIGNILSIKHESLKTLRDSSKLIPGQQYRIIDYITRTSQGNTQSAGHQFDIIVTALNESTLSEEAQAIQNINDGYFDGSNLSAWKIWYCLDNDTTRFAWAGDVKVGEVEHKTYDSSKCTINPELINGNAFITPFNFESCVWVDGDNDGDIEYGGGNDSNHDMNELVYEWGYFTDENGVKQLCIYKSDAGYYAEEGHPDYGDKYLYRGVVNVDGVEYDYWQKWDQERESVIVYGDGDYLYATTQRIVSNPEAYSVTTETKDVYGPGKGVIYRMIDEWNNDVPYDFKNIQFKHPNDATTYPHYYYTFARDNVEDNADCSLDIANSCYSNVIREYSSSGKRMLNNIIFIGSYCYDNSFGSDCYNNSFGSNCYDNSFGPDCSANSFGPDCYDNSFGSNCYDNSFGSGCYDNSFGPDCSANSFGEYCEYNSFGSYCYDNSFGSNCSANSFSPSCSYIKFASDKDATTKYNYYQNNYFGDGCKYIIFKGVETASSSAQVQNYNFSQGLQGTSSTYLTIDGVRNLSYEVKVAKNSKGEIKVYCEADLIA